MLYQDPKLTRLHAFATWARSQKYATFDFRSHTVCAVRQFSGLRLAEWGNAEIELNEIAMEACEAAVQELGVSRHRVPYSYLVTAIEQRIRLLNTA